MVTCRGEYSRNRKTLNDSDSLKLPSNSPAPAVMRSSSAISILDELISAFSDDPQKEGILFMGGSFNPIHSQHIELMQVVKDYFESEYGIRIIAGYLVITTDQYVSHKLKDEAIPFLHRKRLCQLICNGIPDLNWLHPSEYAFGSAIEYLKKEFVNQYPECLLINCMGADNILSHGGTKGKWHRYSQNLQHRKCLTVFINRSGYNEDAYNLYLKDLEKGLVDSDAFRFINVNIDVLSSTMVRRTLKEYQKQKTKGMHMHYEDESGCIEKLRGWIGNQCTDYLIQNIDSIWSHSGSS